MTKIIKYQQLTNDHHRSTLQPSNFGTHYAKAHVAYNQIWEYAILTQHTGFNSPEKQVHYHKCHRNQRMYLRLPIMLRHNFTCTRHSDRIARASLLSYTHTTKQTNAAPSVQVIVEKWGLSIWTHISMSGNIYTMLTNCGTKLYIQLLLWEMVCIEMMYTAFVIQLLCLAPTLACKESAKVHKRVHSSTFALRVWRRYH